MAGAAFLGDEARGDLGDVVGAPDFGFRAHVASSRFPEGDVVIASVDAAAVRGLGDRALTMPKRPPVEIAWDFWRQFETMERLGALRLDRPALYKALPEAPEAQRALACAPAVPTPAVCSIPVLMQSAPMSQRTDSIWRTTKSAGTSWIATMPRVSCAVSAVTAVAA